MPITAANGSRRASRLLSYSAIRASRSFRVSNSSSSSPCEPQARLRACSCGVRTSLGLGSMPVLLAKVKMNHQRMSLRGPAPPDLVTVKMVAAGLEERSQNHPPLSEELVGELRQAPAAVGCALVAEAIRAPPPTPRRYGG